MTTLEILEKTRDILADPKHWSQDGYCQDADKIGIYNLHMALKCEGAICWCSAGAIYKAIGSAADDASFHAVCDVLGFRGIGDLIDWNDEPGRTHAEVLARLDAGIAKLKGAQS